MANQESQRCKTCKFWSSLSSDILPGWGNCSLLSEAGTGDEPSVWDTDIRARAAGRDEGEGYFSTRQDFGCVEWQEGA